MRALRGLWFVLVGLAFVAGGALLLQWQAAQALRSELALVRLENREIERLRAEQERLKAAQITPAELERLQADRSALVRLRGEIETLQKRADERGRETANSQAKAPASPAPRVPALILKLGVGGDGNLSLDGGPLDLNALRQRLAAVVGSTEHVEIRLQMPAENFAQKDALKRSMNALKGLTAELGLRVMIHIDEAPQ